jgi:hypothetical protein
VRAPAFVIEKRFLHHATETAAIVRQFPREVDQRTTIVLASSKDDGSGSNFRLGGHDIRRCSNQNMVPRANWGRTAINLSAEMAQSLRAALKCRADAKAMSLIASPRSTQIAVRPQIQDICLQQVDQNCQATPSENM